MGDTGVLAIEYVCTVFNSIACLMVIGALITIIYCKLKVEKTLWLLLLILWTSIIMKGIYNYQAVVSDFSTESD